MAEANWYVVHTYSGYENKVKANIDKTIENRHLIQMFRGAVNRKIRLLHIHSQVASYTMTRNNSIL